MIEPLDAAAAARPSPSGGSSSMEWGFIIIIIIVFLRKTNDSAFASPTSCCALARRGAGDGMYVPILLLLVCMNIPSMKYLRRLYDSGVYELGSRLRLW